MTDPIKTPETVIAELIVDIRNKLCANCAKPAALKNYLHVRSDKEIIQAIETGELSKSVIHALEWVMFKQDNPKEK